MMTATCRLILTVGVVLTITGCGGSSSPSAISGPTTPPGPNPSASRSMSARIDGVAWTATSVGVQFTNGVLIVSGVDGALTTVGFTSPALATGTYAVAAGSPVAGSLITSAGSWQANGVGSGTGSGSVTITSLTLTSVAGTFTFSLTATPSTGATGTKSITVGAFNVTF